MAISNQTNRTGSGYTNLQRILQANKNNALGSTVGGGVQKAGQAASGAINTAQQQFQTGVQSERQRLGQAGQKVDTVLGNIPGASQEDIDQFSDIRAGQSKGPTGLANADQIQGKAQEAKMLGNAGASETGRYGLLQRYVGGNQRYGAGNQRLDNLLLGQTGQPQLRQARASTAGVANQAQNAITSAGEVGKEVQGEAKQLGQQTVGKLQGAVGQYDTDIQNKLAAEQTRRQGYLASLNSQDTPNSNQAINFDDRALSDITAASHGVLGEGTNLYTADVSPYVKLNDLYAKTQYAQSADDLAKAQMLGKLSGNDLGDKASILQGYTADPTAAGQYAANNYFNVSSDIDLNNAIQNSANAYNTRKSNLQVEKDWTDAVVNREQDNLARGVNNLAFPLIQRANDNRQPANLSNEEQQIMDAIKQVVPSYDGHSGLDYEQSAAVEKLLPGQNFGQYGYNKNTLADARNTLNSNIQNLNNVGSNFNILRKLQKAPSV